MEIDRGEDQFRGHLNHIRMRVSRHVLLRDFRRQKNGTMDQLYRTAQDRHMANVMRPYLESLA